MPEAYFIRHITSLSTNTIGTDGLNALLSIPGVSDPEIVEESNDYVIISYLWDTQGLAPDDLDLHFRRFGLQKITI